MEPVEGQDARSAVHTLVAALRTGNTVEAFIVRVLQSLQHATDHWYMYVY